MMTKAVVVLAVTVAVACGLPTDRAAVAATAGLTTEERFEQFVEEHQKVYVDDAEKRYRLEVFRANMDQADEMNAEEGAVVFGASKFADLTPLEFRTRYLTYKPVANFSTLELESLMHTSTTDEASAPTKINWKDHGALTPVKDQGNCGSCWAFSATEQIESDVFLATGKLPTLAPQQIVSCDKKDLGCNGGDTPTAYAYVKKAGGMEAESSYPYKSGRTGRNGKCSESSSKLVSDISGFKYVSKKGHRMNEGAMASYIGTTGPLSICVDASSWQTYESGIIKKKCGHDLDHCVQAVGYNKEGATPYWIIRNSWNTDWGEEGFIYVEMDKDLCGVAYEATYTTGGAPVV